MRTIKSRSNGEKRQTIAHHNGYDHLEGKWLTYYKVASRFRNKVMAQDRDDILHDIIIALAVVENGNGHRPFTEAVTYRIASRTVADYWYRHYKITSGLDCGHCSRKQRLICKDDYLYAECRKSIKLESLNKTIMDSDGNITELGELIADDRALDLDAWVDARTFLLGFPKRLTEIAHKLDNGEALPNSDRLYLSKWRRREKISLLR